MKSRAEIEALISDYQSQNVDVLLTIGMGEKSEFSDFCK